MAPESHRPLVSFSLQVFESQLLDLVSLSEVLMIFVCELYQQQTGLQGTESHYKGHLQKLGDQAQRTGFTGGTQAAKHCMAKQRDRDLLSGGVWAVGG